MDFYKRLSKVGAHIPYGKVVTYGQLALLCGKPQNSRQAGYALNRGLAGNAFPAHRVVNSKGILSGAPAFETPDMQRILLESEGVVINNNQVDLKKYGWLNSMAEAEALRNEFEREGI